MGARLQKAARIVCAEVFIYVTGAICAGAWCAVPCSAMLCLEELQRGLCREMAHFMGCWCCQGTAVSKAPSMKWSLLSLQAGKIRSGHGAVKGLVGGAAAVPGIRLGSSRCFVALGTVSASWLDACGAWTTQQMVGPA